jgi:hypothetical protein
VVVVAEAKAVLLTQCSVALVAVVQSLMRCLQWFQPQAIRLQSALVALVVQVLVALMDQEPREALHPLELYSQSLVAAQAVTMQLLDTRLQAVQVV